MIETFQRLAHAPFHKKEVISTLQHCLDRVSTDKTLHTTGLLFDSLVPLWKKLDFSDTDVELARGRIQNKNQPITEGSLFVSKMILQKTQGYLLHDRDENGQPRVMSRSLEVVNQLRNIFKWCGAPEIIDEIKQACTESRTIDFDEINQLRKQGKILDFIPESRAEGKY